MTETKTMTMRVSMDGLRRNLASAYKKAVSGYREAVSENGYDCSFSDLRDGLDELRQMIGALMCVYSKDPEDEMSDMADDCDSLPFASHEDED